MKCIVPFLGVLALLVGCASQQPSAKQKSAESTPVEQHPLHVETALGGTPIPSEEVGRLSKGLAGGGGQQVVEQPPVKEEAAAKETDEERIVREKQRAGSEAMYKLQKSRDEIEGIDWYGYPPRLSDLSDKRPLRDRMNNIHAYIGKKNGLVWLRLKMSYGGAMLFVKSVVFNVDGERHELQYGPLDDWDRGFILPNSSIAGESKDVLVDLNTWSLINKIANSNKTLMRYEGRQFKSDREINEAEKRALKDTLLAYEFMGGKPPSE